MLSFKEIRELIDLVAERNLAGQSRALDTRQPGQLDVEEDDRRERDREREVEAGPVRVANPALQPGFRHVGGGRLLRLLQRLLRRLSPSFRLHLRAR